jgi:hypothetical protein
MKKLVSIYCVLSILLSVSLFFECSGKEISFCHIDACRDAQSSDPSSCVACTSHAETTSFMTPYLESIFLNPVVVGEISFKLIHIFSEKNILLPDRPPSLS